GLADSRTEIAHRHNPWRPHRKSSSDNPRSHPQTHPVRNPGGKNRHGVRELAQDHPRTAGWPAGNLRGRNPPRPPVRSRTRLLRPAAPDEHFVSRSKAAAESALALEREARSNTAGTADGAIDGAIDDFDPDSLNTFNDLDNDR